MINASKRTLSGAVLISLALILGLILPASPASSYALATWSGPFAVSVPGVATYDPIIRLSSDGTMATALWRSFNGTSSIKTASARLSGGTATWGQITDLTPPDFNANAGADLALSGDGSRAVAVWTGGDSGAGVTKSASAAIVGDSATWGSAQPISPVGLVTAAPSVLISADGTRATAAWLAGENQQIGLETASAVVSGTSSTWGAVVELVAPSSTVPYCDLGLSADGTRAMAMWEANAGSTTIFKSASAAISGTTSVWGGVSSVSPPVASVWASDLELSVDGSRATALWASWDGTTTTVAGTSAVISGSGATWGPAQTIASPPLATAAALAASSDGTVLAAEWLDWQGGRSVVRARGSTVSGTTQYWGTVDTLTSPSDVNPWPGGIEMSADGLQVIASWVGGSTSSVPLTAAGQVVGNSVSWGTTSNVRVGSTSGESSVGLRIELSASGGVAAALFKTSNEGNLQSAVAEITDPPPTAQEPVNRCVNAPRRIKPGKKRRLMKAKCATTDGQPVGLIVQVRDRRDARRKRARSSFRVMCHFGIRENNNMRAVPTGWGNGAVYCPAFRGPMLIRVFRKRTQLMLTWYSPPTATASEYRLTRRYRT